MSVSRVLVVPLLLALGLSLSCCPGSSALKLPSYIKPCREDDPQINECAVKNGREAIPNLLNGDRKYKIPNLNPLTVYDFILNEGTGSVGIRIHLKEAKIYGLSGADFTAARIDIQKRHVEFDFSFDRVVILGDYNVTGRVLLLPVVGSGDANITITQLQLTYKFDFVLEQGKKDGKEYCVITDGKVNFEAGRAYFRLDNLFNGDRLLGENTNRFLNENWKEVVRELGPSVADAIGQVIGQILAQITELVPYSYLFTS